MGTDLPLPVFLAGRCQPRARARPRVRRTSRASAFSGLDTTLSRGADTLYSAGLPDACAGMPPRRCTIRHAMPIDDIDATEFHIVCPYCGEEAEITVEP